MEEKAQSEYLSFLNQRLDASEDKRKEHLKIFNTVKEQLQRSKRNKRSTDSTLTFSQEQRSSLGNMYSFHDGLKIASEKLALELQKQVPKFDIPELHLKLLRLKWKILKKRYQLFENVKSL
ncbi:hypothetical protein OVS_03405 [Mycoplasma ovis str. Michigan]|uniref:Uncharacterized protein n=1 Tax=Mycoplasma ovis str. Michigan TaxID=1415773 RepID=A0ABN4BNH0_9MOLU|nr:hypothetical protein [Mycoplasma ovis]AHC40432.1 hypothetical protein OVS_03405 [Mycoplasma ovis str. Michigan]